MLAGLPSNPRRSLLKLVNNGAAEQRQQTTCGMSAGKLRKCEVVDQLRKQVRQPEASAALNYALTEGIQHSPVLVRASPPKRMDAQFISEGDQNVNVSPVYSMPNPAA